jgi:acetoin utilization deacetylase AcuC-like enzyme/GNAT superfamily N-acetyltransferase
LFRIRRIHDDVLSANRAALERVQELLREQFPDLPEERVAELPGQMRNPLTSGFRTVVFVAETREGLRGAAVLLHAPDLEFCFLDFIAAMRGETGAGIGSALYERVREECRLLEVKALFLECLPDGDVAVQKPGFVPAVQSPLRFYAKYGARRVVNTAYEAPISEGDTDTMPYLVVDDLGQDHVLRRAEGRAIVRAILERRYGWLCPPEYIEKVVRSFVDDPVVLDALRQKPSQPRLSPVRDPRLPSIPADLRVLVVANEKHDIHHVRERGYVESPARVSAIRRELGKTDLFEFSKPGRFGDEHVLAVHDADFVRYLERMCASLKDKPSVYPYVFPIRNPARPPRDMPVRAGYYCIDTFTPLHYNAWPAARRAVDCALTGAQSMLDGRHFAYALVRPPGHHAERRVFGGFCYLNSAGVAAHYLSSHGKVAILDVDYHHGNGQQDIFYRRPDVLTISIHGDPVFAYPYFTGFAEEVGEGEGEGFNLNLPLAENITAAQYVKTLAYALNRIRQFAPSFLVVCLGLDTAKSDPTGTWSLSAADFEANGLRIGALNLPTLVVQEGGYNTRTLGVNVRHFFRGLYTGAAQAKRYTRPLTESFFPLRTRSG